MAKLTVITPLEPKGRGSDSHSEHIQLESGPESAIATGNYLSFPQSL